jgi:hypothetical protein
VLELLDSKLVGAAVDRLLGEHADAPSDPLAFDLWRHLFGPREESVPLADVLLDSPLQNDDLLAQLHAHPSEVTRCITGSRGIAIECPP